MASLLMKGCVGARQARTSARGVGRRRADREGVVRRLIRLICLLRGHHWRASQSRLGWETCRRCRLSRTLAA
jgi:hypothetical protein